MGQDVELHLSTLTQHLIIHRCAIMCVCVCVTEGRWKSILPQHFERHYEPCSRLEETKSARPYTVKVLQDTSLNKREKSTCKIKYMGMLACSWQPK